MNTLSIVILSDDISFPTGEHLMFRIKHISKKMRSKGAEISLSHISLKREQIIEISEVYDGICHFLYKKGFLGGLSGKYIWLIPANMVLDFEFFSLDSLVEILSDNANFYILEQIHGKSYTQDEIENPRQAHLYSSNCKINNYMPINFFLECFFIIKVKSLLDFLTSKKLTFNIYEFFIDCVLKIDRPPQKISTFSLTVNRKIGSQYFNSLVDLSNHNTKFYKRIIYAASNCIINAYENYAPCDDVHNLISKFSAFVIFSVLQQLSIDCRTVFSKSSTQHDRVIFFRESENVVSDLIRLSCIFFQNGCLIADLCVLHQFINLFFTNMGVKKSSEDDFTSTEPNISKLCNLFFISHGLEVKLLDVARQKMLLLIANANNSCCHC